MGYMNIVYTISCLLITTQCVNSQYPLPYTHWDPNINPDYIYFERPTPSYQVSAASQLNTAVETNFDQNADQYRSGLPTTGKERISLDETARALTNFSINLMKQVSQQNQGKNTVVSPYSIATVLSLLQQGATGVTLEELSKVLQMNQQKSAAAYKTQTQDIESRSSRNILRTAINIFLADGFSLSPAFRSVAQKDFHSDVTPTNFVVADKAAKEINSWVAARTDNKIDNLIAPDALSINTQMVLVNAMYFKGLWEMPFKKQFTTPGEFLLGTRTKKMAQFMTTTRHLRTGVDSYIASKVIILPFEHQEYSLMVILPHSLSSIDETLSTLNPLRLEQYLNFPPLEVQLELPKFSVKSDTDLTQVLKKMGVSKLFSQDSDLIKIGTFEGLSPQVTTAVHSAAFTIDEEGGSAAASTAFAVVALSNDSPSVVFKVNRPFIAVLWDGKTRLPLFVAKIEDPTT